MPVSSLELREIGPEWDAAWDELVGSTPETGFMQMSAWMDFKQREGFEAVRYGLFDPEKEGEQDGLLGGGTLFSYPAEEGERFIVCPEGPVLPWHDTARARKGLRKLLAVVQEDPERGRSLGLRIEPHLPPPAPSLLRNWSRAPIDLTPLHTLMLDLTLSDPELKAQMVPKGRYNLGLAERHGVRITSSTDLGDMARFYTLFAETARRNDFFQEPYGFFLNLGAALFPTRATLYFAEWEEKTLAAILVVYCGRRATYLYGGSTALHREVMPNYLLQWTAAQEARERGCVEYDLYGYEPFGLTDHLYAGISRFKKQFGGKRVDWMGAKDYLFYDRLADRVIHRLKSAV